MGLISAIARHLFPSSAEHRLFVAASAGDIDAVRGMLDKFPDAVRWNAEHASHATALMWAASSGRAEIVKLLLDRGADIEARDSEGRTPFRYAADGLVRGQAELDPDPSPKFDMEDPIGAAQLLAARGADTNTKDNDGQTALSRTCCGFAEQAGFLVDLGANVDAQNPFGLTALMLAASAKSDEVVKMLLDKGASVTVRDGEGKTALDHAVESDSFKYTSRHGATISLLQDAMEKQRPAEEARRKAIDDETARRVLHDNTILPRDVQIAPPLKLKKRAL